MQQGNEGKSIMKCEPKQSSYLLQIQVNVKQSESLAQWACYSTHIEFKERLQPLYSWVFFVLNYRFLVLHARYMNKMLD